jgi:SAM-dependent methyltransferase
LTDTPEKFYSSACEEADRIAWDIGLNDATTILDIGCGVGRLPIGLLARGAAFAFYLGIDVAKDRVEWCANNLAPRDPRLHYQAFDMHNARYNPGGQGALDLAVPPGSIDIVYVYSVFSHLIEADIRTYLDLIAKVLRPAGVGFVTMFVADGVPPMTENPAGFGPCEWSGPLHCVLYNRGYWYAMVEAAGLKILRELPHVNVDQQTGYFLTHAAPAVHRGGVVPTGAGGGPQKRRGFVGFFGLNRSLRWTYQSIERNIIGRLAAAGIEPVIAAHFNCPETFYSPRSGEAHIPFNLEGLDKLAAELMWLERQRDDNILNDLPLVLRTPVKNEEDPDGVTRRNVLQQLYSLSRLSKVLDQLEPNSFDLFCFLRADLIYLDPMPVDDILELIKDRGADIVTASWHKWTGLNDRFAFCSRRGADAYLNRREWVRDLCVETGTFHSESLLLFMVEKTGLKVGFTGMRAQRVRANGVVKEEDFTL